ncbi:hypothetical protein GCM10010103_75580 [Streptomyces paradoxus]|uniref:Uncharacterized protein n=1 Tax=Streptomyces paradoxus TaxID=66375 RepID=A0A7W9WLR3_9ACTN|nr:hypothetical protein [Streptomyces paradoxus]MBB6081619.1 hypothetical protein [Streptomyces paradoxus]
MTLVIVEPPVPGEHGRRVIVRCPEAERCIGIAHSDQELLRLLEKVGLTGYENDLDLPGAVEWRELGPHQWERPS